MIAPRPNCFSIWRMAASTARLRSPFRSGGVGVWAWAGAAGASMGFVGSFSVAPGCRIRSLLLAGFGARLALGLDHFDRRRWLIGRYRWHLRRLGLRLSLLLVARSISAFRHLQQTSDLAGRGVAIACRTGLIRPLPAAYRLRPVLETAPRRPPAAMRTTRRPGCRGSAASGREYR